MNIISNAVKYNKEKGVILLSYYETQVDDRHILFEFHCKDTGVGMSKEFQNHIFEPFTQETGGARSVYGGTGLGMPITKKLIEKMGGTIKFESEKNVGTTFMVQLPFLISADMKQADHDTVGTERQFQTTSGRTVYVYGSAYGWKIDQDKEVAQLMQEIQSGTQTTREPVYSMRANAHGINDLGDTYIEVDLTEQYMWYYQNGNIIFQSEIVSGLPSDPNRKTPPGIFTLNSKSSPSVLRGEMTANGTYSYEQPVTYWMPFNGGIGFHDADWQPYFGGDRYLTGGSHGCINLPPENAGQLYSLIQYDVPIICFY